MRFPFFVLAVFAAAPAQAITFTATVLQTPEGVAMQGFGLNNRGDVVGGAGEGGAYQAYLRTAEGSFQALGGFGGTRSTAVAIADNGIIAGQARTGATGATSTPFIRYDDGALTPIALPSGGMAALTEGVSASGIVTGSYTATEPNGLRHSVGFRWSQAQGLETLSSVNGAFTVGIAGSNDAGVAVGTALGSDASPFRWNADGSVTQLQKLSGVPPDFYNDGYANAINDGGLIAGSVMASGADNGGFVDTNLLAIWGNDGRLLRTAQVEQNFNGDLAAINAFGDAVGSISRTVFDPVTQTFVEEGHVVLWLANEGPVDIGSLLVGGPLDLRGAFGINDSRQIVAWGYANGVRFDVLLTPVTAGVPEPASWALMILGFGIAGASLRRPARPKAITG